MAIIFFVFVNNGNLFLTCLVFMHTKRSNILAPKTRQLLPVKYTSDSMEQRAATLLLMHKAIDWLIVGGAKGAPRR